MYVHIEHSSIYLYNHKADGPDILFLHSINADHVPVRAEVQQQAQREVQPPVLAVSNQQVVLGWLVFISPTTAVERTTAAAAAVRIALSRYLIEDKKLL